MGLAVGDVEGLADRPLVGRAIGPRPALDQLDPLQIEPRVAGRPRILAGYRGATSCIEGSR